jgi:hypothetical protein
MRGSSEPSVRVRSLGVPSVLMLVRLADLYGKGRTIPELAAEYEVGGIGTIWRALQPEISEAA